MFKGSFFTPVEEAQKFFKESVMNEQEGLYVSWLTDPKVVEKIVPPPLTPVAPIVTCYIINIQRPTFCSRYTEAAIAIPCTYENVSGVYWISFMLAGPGAHMGTFAGREMGGIPKKIADDIRVERIGNYARGTVIRHGRKLIEIEMDINGHFNNPAAANVYGDPQPGQEVLLNGFFYKYDCNKGEDGIVRFTDGRLISMNFDTTYHTFEKGCAEVKLFDSIEDPWSELTVVEVLGGGYATDDIDLSSSRVLTEVDAEEIVPYLLSARYDKGALNQGETVFF